MINDFINGNANEYVEKHLVGQSCKILFKALREDPGFYYSYQANIAVSFMDEYYRKEKKYKNRDDIHQIANTAAKYFLDLLIKEK